MKTDQSKAIWCVFWSWSHVCGNIYITETDLNAARLCSHPTCEDGILFEFFLWYFAFNSWLREWLLTEGETITMHHHQVESSSSSLFVYLFRLQH